jgi:hypothetical protein
VALNTVALVLDLYDGTQSPITTGTATFRPNVQVKDATDHVVLTTAPVIIQLVRNPVPTVTLIATDNGALSPSGWTWIYRGTFDGAGVEQSFLLPFSGGATQYLSQLVPTSSTPAAYSLIGVSGTPVSGQVITATGPTAAHWATPGTGLALDTTASDIQPLGTRAAGSSSLAAAADHVHATTNIIDGVTVSGVPVAGNAITATSGTTANWQTPAAGVTLDTTATDIQPLGTRAAGATGKAADAGHVHPVTGLIDTTASDIQPLGTRAAGSTGLAADAGHVHATTNVIDGVTVSGVPVAGNVITATSGSAANWQTPAAGVTLDSTSTDIQALGTQAAGGTGKAADAGHVHPTTGLAIIDSTATDIQPLGTRAAGSVGKAADAGHVHPTTGVQTAVIASTSTDSAALGTQAAGATGKLADAGHVHPATGVALLAGATFTGAVAPAVVALTDAATIAVNASLGNDFRVTIAGNRTLGNPTSPVDGQMITVLVTQDGTGSRTLSYGTAWEFSTGLPSPTLSTGANVTDALGFKYVASKSKWFLLAFLAGFA